MTLAIVRLSLILHRFLLVATTVAVLILASAAVWYAARLDALPHSTSCLAAADYACRPFVLLAQSAGPVLAALALLPVAAGLIVGVSILGQEFDRATTTLAWSLEPSRWRWFAQRLLPILALMLAVGLLAGVVGDYLEGRLFPAADPLASFHNFGLRGPLVAARLLLALATGVFTAAIVGRMLPALLIATVVSLGLIGAVTAAHQGLQARESVAVDQEQLDASFAGQQVDFRYQLPSGEEVTYEELAARFSDPTELDRQVQAARQLVYVIPAERYPEIINREAAMTGGLGLLLLFGAIPVVARRQPGPGCVRLRVPTIRLRERRRRPIGSADPPSTLGTARLVLWPHRPELFAGAALGVAVSVGSVVVVAVLRTLAPPDHCLADLGNGIPFTDSCATADQFLLIASEWGSRVFSAMAIVPWLVGALIGVVVVGREIEQRTATLAWSLSGDRRRWLLTRAAVAGALVVVLLGLPSILTGDLQSIARPWVAPEQTFDNYGLRGPLVVARGLVAFAVALFVGAWLGRTLPALLTSLAACGAIAMVMDALVPFGVAVDRRMSVGYHAALLGPGQLSQVEFRETAVLGILMAVSVTAAALVVDRRRPY